MTGLSQNNKQALFFSSGNVQTQESFLQKYWWCQFFIGFVCSFGYSSFQWLQAAFNWRRDFFVKSRHLNSLLFFWKPLVYLLLLDILSEPLFFLEGLFQMCLLTCLSLLPPLQKYSGHFILLLDSEAVFSACLTLLVIYIKTRLKEKVCLPQVEKPMVCPSFASLSNPLLKLF